MAKIVIIGNGISGVTTARYIRKRDSDAEITIISSETKYFFSRTALMYIYMGHMEFDHTKPYEDSFWEKNRIELCFAHVSQVDFENKSLSFESGNTLQYDKLVFAVGSKPNMFDWPGKDLKGVQSLYSCQDLILMEKNTEQVKKAVVVGGGLIGVEMVEMLLSRNIEVTFIIRETHFWSNVLSNKESELLHRHMIEHGVDVKLDNVLQEITSDQNGRVNGIITGNGEKIDCQFVGITVGVRPNISFLENSSLETNRGILVDSYLQTNKPDVYAIGDCAQFRVAPPGRGILEQVWYTGRMMGETLAETITGSKREYLPGNWFNSAKFFDIEYQTYGQVPAQLSEENVELNRKYKTDPKAFRQKLDSKTGDVSEIDLTKEDIAEYYWQHPSENKALRMVFNLRTERFIGLNVFGIRMRHEVIDNWLSEKKSIDEAMELLNDAWFDPELYKNDFKEIVSDFNQTFQKNVRLKTKSWTRILERIKA